MPVEPGGGNLLEIKLLGNQLPGSTWPRQTWHPWLIDPRGRCQGDGGQVKAFPYLFSLVWGEMLMWEVVWWGCDE